MVVHFARTHIPKQIHNLSPNSFLHKLITTAFENSGPLFRTVMGIKSRPLMWLREMVDLHHRRDVLLRTPAGNRGSHLQLERMYNLREVSPPRTNTLPPHPA